MNHRTTLIAGLAVGFAVIAPGAALASTGTSAPTAPSTPTSATPTETAPPTTTPGDGNPGVPKAYVSVSPHSGLPGQKVTVETGCEFKYVTGLTSNALDIGKLHQVGPQTDPSIAPRAQAAATVKKNVKPGVYKVSFDCGGAKITTSFTVLTPKPPVKTGQQVTKVPAGAPQTGGGGTAGDPTSYTGLIAALSGAAVLAAGAGVVVYRRRLARQD